MFSEIVVIGAGVSGLHCAGLLSATGRKLLVLEASARCGGRVNTIKEEGHFLESGAEFVHGRAPLTMELLERAGIVAAVHPGTMYRIRKGTVTADAELVHHMSKVLKQLDKLKEDVSVKEFLDEHFASEEHKKLRKSLVDLVMGFDAADPARMSAFALRTELMDDSAADSRQLNGPASCLVKHLYNVAINSGCDFGFEQRVTGIDFSEGHVKVFTVDAVYECARCIITVPLPVYSQLKFQPSIPQHLKVINSFGYGNVVKIFLGFRRKVWESKELAGKILQLPGMSFLFGDQSVPVWWTGLDPESTVLTGWCGGPLSNRFSGYQEEQMCTEAVRALAATLATDENVIKEELWFARAVDWAQNPFAGGAYSYHSVESRRDFKLLLNGVENKLFFAGEAFESRGQVSTVESALSSAVHISELIQGIAQV